jgi:hypothetical protein
MFFSCQYHSAKAPHSSYITHNKRKAESSLGNFRQSNALSEFGKLWIQNYFIVVNYAECFQTEGIAEIGGKVMEKGQKGN